MNKEDILLSYDEFEFVTDIIILALDTEITKITNEEELEEVLSNLLNSYYTRSSHSFFILISLKEITIETFSNIPIRDLILNIADRVSIQLSTQDFSKDRLINTITTGICYNRTNTNYINNSLISSDINNALFINQDTLNSCLRDNFWLVVLYLMLMFFHKSKIFNYLKAK